jgi:predicted TIM-barrel fold metal-dependent hydrolase
MRIVDAHHHVWRQQDLPWLQGPSLPRIFGDYDPIKRDYPIEEYLDDIRTSGVAKSVYVQANWSPDRVEAEAAWVQSTADRTGWPHAIVAYADMTVPDVRPALDALAKYPLLRGIRQQFHWHENPQYRFAATPDLCRDPTVQANVARLADYGLAFDLQVFAPQMPGAAALADASPSVTFVLQHSGMIEDLSDDGRAEWKAAMRDLAKRPNVTAKLSAFGTFIHRNDPAHIERILHDTVEIFGPARCLWGSNFPIEKLWTTYPELLSAFRRAAADLSTNAQADIFERTAIRVYRL